MEPSPSCNDRDKIGVYVSTSQRGVTSPHNLLGTHRVKKTKSMSLSALNAIKSILSRQRQDWFNTPVTDGMPSNIDKLDLPLVTGCIRALDVNPKPSAQVFVFGFAHRPFLLLKAPGRNSWLAYCVHRKYVSELPDRQRTTRQAKII
ncbi:hypothetical protein BaRGS_00038137 [Batillaria attramentaria]|uniref:Uncharacterized protein n=1 Tax=Batillaria attramentaria TaxID=370345 RepID=A0ABD0J7R7_9CAEN